MTSGRACLFHWFDATVQKVLFCNQWEILNRPTNSWFKNCFCQIWEKRESPLSTSLEKCCHFFNANLITYYYFIFFVCFHNWIKHPIALFFNLEAKKRILSICCIKSYSYIFCSFLFSCCYQACHSANSSFLTGVHQQQDALFLCLIFLALCFFLSYYL